MISTKIIQHNYYYIQHRNNHLTAKRMSYRLNGIVAVDNLGEPPCCCGLLLWLPVRWAGGVCGGVAAGELATVFVRELEMDGSFEVTLPLAERGAEFKRGEA